MNQDKPVPNPAAIAALLAFSTLVVYWRVTQHGFINYDDPGYITYNARVQAGLSWENVCWAFTTTHFNYWHPLTWLSHMLDCQLFGLRAGAHHFVNVLFHAANSALLFLALTRMTRAMWPSAFVAAMFAWHPLHVETVAWMADRKGVLSTFFWMLALLAYARHVERPGAGRYAAVLVCYALGLMAKPMVVTLPFILLLLDWWPLRRFQGAEANADSSATAAVPQNWRGLLIEKLPFFALTVVSCVITYYAQQSVRAVVSLARLSFASRAGTALAGYFDYIVSTVWPAGLAVFYPLPETQPAWKLAASAVLLLSISALAIRWARTRGWFLVGWLFYLGTLVPMIGLVQVGDQARADRYIYLPLIGLGVMIAWGGAELASRARGLALGMRCTGLAVVGFWILATGVQVSYWKNNETLFGRAHAVTSRNHVALTVLGNLLAADGKIAEAKACFIQALSARPNYETAIGGLADTFVVEGDLEKAIALYERAIAINPKLADAHNALGVVLMRQNRVAEATARFAHAVKADPYHAEAQFNWSLAMEQQGRMADALTGYARVMQLKPDSVPALNQVAWILATSLDEKHRNGPQALRAATRVCELTGHQDARSLLSLAVALAETGRIADATATAQKATALAQAGGNKELVELGQKILARSQAGEPYRETGK